MHLNHYDYDTVIVYNDGQTKSAKVEITASAVPDTFPVDGAGMTGKFPTSDPANTIFQPGSYIFIPVSCQVYMLDPDGQWNEI